MLDAVFEKLRREQLGRELLGGLGPLPEPLPLLMDRA